jgi:hypothetical protein
LRGQIELMPRQAIYTLAARHGEIEKKQQFVKDYSGETKNELLEQIRELFPLEERDGRRRMAGIALLTGLKRLFQDLQRSAHEISLREKNNLLTLLEEMHRHLAG